MSKLRIYGPAGGRTARVVWAADELGLDCERIEITPEGKSAFAAVNPNMRFPAVEDGDTVLFESLAITLYLARKYGAGSLWPTDVADEGRALQWTFWALSDLEPSLLNCLRERVWKPEALRDPAAATAAEAALAKPLQVLEDALAVHPYLLGDAFTIADLNAVGVLSFCGKGGVSLAAFPKVTAWLEACQARPKAAAFAAAWPAPARPA